MTGSSRNLSNEELPGAIGRYHIIEKIGEGGAGVVYKARDSNLRRIVALKVIEDTGINSQNLQRLKREARVTANLVHPNIVKLYDFCMIGDKTLVAMEFVDGLTLKHLLEQKELSWHRICEIILEVLGAIRFAHEKGFIHRDIKPSNILIDRRGRAHLTDFGLVKEIGGSGGAARLSMEGEILGTPAFMSPEQAQTEEVAVVDERSDIYSLGVVMYAMLTGRLPFEGESAFTLLFKLTNEDPPTPRQINPKIPRELDYICYKALARDRKRRYQDAGEMVLDIRQYLRKTKKLGANSPLIPPAKKLVKKRTMADTAIRLPTEPSLLQEIKEGNLHKTKGRTKAKVRKHWTLDFSKEDDTQGKRQVEPETKEPLDNFSTEKILVVSLCLGAIAIAVGYFVAVFLSQGQKVESKAERRRQADVLWQSLQQMSWPELRQNAKEFEKFTEQGEYEEFGYRVRAAAELKAIRSYQEALRKEDVFRRWWTFKNIQVRYSDTIVVAATEERRKSWEREAQQQLNSFFDRLTKLADELKFGEALEYYDKTVEPRQEIIAVMAEKIAAIRVVQKELEFAENTVKKGLERRRQAELEREARVAIEKIRSLPEKERTRQMERFLQQPRYQETRIYRWAQQLRQQWPAQRPVEKSSQYQDILSTKDVFQRWRGLRKFSFFYGRSFSRADVAEAIAGCEKKMAENIEDLYSELDSLQQQRQFIEARKKLRRSSVSLDHLEEMSLFSAPLEQLCQKFSRLVYKIEEQAQIQLQRQEDKRKAKLVYISYLKKVMQNDGEEQLLCSKYLLTLFERRLEYKREIRNQVKEHGIPDLRDLRAKFVDEGKISLSWGGPRFLDPAIVIRQQNGWKFHGNEDFQAWLRREVYHYD